MYHAAHNVIGMVMHSYCRTTEQDAATSSLTMAFYGHDHILFAETYALFAATDTMPARGLGDTGSSGEAACYSAYLAYLCCVHDCTQASGNTTAQEGDRLQGRLLVDLSYTNFVYHSVL